MMQMIYEKIPILEVWSRMLYKKALQLGILHGRIVPNEKARDVRHVNIGELTNVLEKNGIKRGDVLIVHSSMKGIRGFGKDPDGIIQYLQNIVGEEGMLLMPTYPEYPSSKIELTFNEKYDNEFTYNVDETRAWTGIITNEFWKREDVIRSNYPNNTLAAWGNEKEKPFYNELTTDLAYDKKSAWRYCMDKHAKVLFLGIHAHHSLSEIHIAEDYLGEDFPIKGWYTEKKYRIITSQGEIAKTCRVRKAFWTKYMTEYYGCYRLRKEKLLIEGKIGNINYSIVPDLYEFEKYVEECAVKGDLLYFRIPRRFRKK